MADITYTPQFQAPTWHDSIDLIAAQGPRGFNAQFQSLQAELVNLSDIVKQLNDALVSLNQGAQTSNSAVQALQTALRAVQIARWGDIKADASIGAGSGNFTVKKAGTGLFDITFSPAFTAVPTVVAMQIYPWGNSDSGSPAISSTGSITTMGMMTTDNAVVVGITLSQCRIKTGDGGGNASDRPFSFLAYGPTS